MNIVMFETEAWQAAACQRLGPSHRVRCVAEALTPATAHEFADAEVISTFIDSKLDAKTLGALIKLRLIATRSTGYDHIDLAACRAADVAVCNVPNYGDPTVAEYAFALLLALSRKVPQAAERTRRGDFSQAGLRGFDLAGKVMGVVGVGRIGQRAIQIAKGFGMSVVAFDARPDKSLEETLGMRFVPLNHLLKTSDVVSLHVPGGPGTRDLISAAKLARMKPSAVLINTARGDVVDTEALLAALAGDRLAGAGLDVFSQEPWLRDEAEIFRAGAGLEAAGLRMLAADHALLASPKVIASAHVAYDTQEAVVRILDTTLANITAFEAGAPTNLVGAPAPQGGGSVAVLASASGLRLGEAFRPLIEDVVAQRAAFLQTPTAARVHALRGALRRVGAGLLLFKTLLPRKDVAWIRHELDRVTRQLGPVRDLDVLIQRQADERASDPMAAAQAAPLDKAVAQARQVAVARARRQARAVRVAILTDGLEAWLDAQSGQAPEAGLSTAMIGWLLVADAKVRVTGREDVRGGQHARHRLRGRLKTLRYNTELFLRLHHQASDGAYLAALEDLHDGLGDLNDETVGARLLHALTSGPGAGEPSPGHRRKAKVLKAAWRRFKAVRPPWGAAKGKASQDAPDEGRASPILLAGPRRESLGLGSRS